MDCGEELGSAVEGEGGRRNGGRPPGAWRELSSIRFGSGPAGCSDQIGRAHV